MTAVATQNPIAEIVKDRQKFSLNSTNGLFIVDSEGVLACLKSADSKSVTPVGFIEPQLLIDQLTADRPVNTGLVPRGTIFYERFTVDKSIYHMYILEFEPKIMAIRQVFGYSKRDGAIDTFNIAMPFIQFAIALKELGPGQFSTSGYSYIGCTTKPIISLDDPVYCLPLHNIGSAGSICWGDQSISKAANDTTSSYIRKVVSTFFSGIFNDHLYPKWPKEWTKTFPGGNAHAQTKFCMTYWADQSKVDPMFVLNTEFEKLGTLRTMYETVKNTAKAY